MQTLKLGFIGSGYIARFMMSAVSQVRGLEISAVYSLEGADEFAALVRGNDLGECIVCDSIADLVAKCDAPCVFAPNFTRVEVIREITNAVKAGAGVKGVICEKPLGRTVAEALEIQALAKEGGYPTAYFENQLFMKPITAQREQLAPQQSAMGPLSLSRCSEEHAGPHAPWFWDPTRQGGGVLLDMACHSIACAWFCLTPLGKPLTFLQPVEISCDIALLKWGLPRYSAELKERMGVDYTKTPAEDFCTGMVTFLNPETGQMSKAQFTNSWMYDKQGLRLYMDGLGPGYAFELNTLQSPLQIFIGDQAADAAADAEKALEKATATRGLLAVQSNEADLYGYVDEMINARDAFLAGQDAMATWSYGVEVTKLCMAAYMAAERKQTLDLTDETVQKQLEAFVPLVAQGRGRECLQVG